MVAIEPRGHLDLVHPVKEPTTMSTLRIAGLAGLLVVAALVGGTIIGSVAATTLQPTTPSSAGAAASGAVAAASGAPAGTKAAAYCAEFRRAFAANLGVDVSALA